MKVYTITQNQLGSKFTTKDIVIVSETIEDSEKGESWTIEVSEMSEEDYDDLPEFEGF